MSETNYVTGPQVLTRYHITDMTLWRWLKDEKLGFPKPLVIRRRRLWVPAELDAFDARQRGEAA
jgi:predicted DNA-binding transcriptional regulator AlpA